MSSVSRIPRQFQLGPHTVKVSIVSYADMERVARTPNADYDPDDDDEDKSVPWGLWVRGENAIFVQRVRPGFNASQQLHTFWHEYFHALFSMLNRPGMSDNEELVDQCGLLHLQMQQTAKY